MCATKSPPKWTEKRAPLGALFFRVAPGGSLFKMCRKIFRFCSEPSKTHGEKNPHENERNEERPKRALFFRGAPGVALFPIYGIFFLNLQQLLMPPFIYAPSEILCFEAFFSTRKSFFTIQDRFYQRA